MAAATVRDVLGDLPSMEFEWDSTENIDPKNIWADYDAESDSFILYTVGKPRGGVHVYVGDGLYAIVDRKTKKAIGFYVENWQSSFVPAHKELKRAWAGLSPTPQDTWVALLRMMALWLLAMIMANANRDDSHQLQPV